MKVFGGQAKASKRDESTLAYLPRPQEADSIEPDETGSFKLPVKKSNLLAGRPDENRKVKILRFDREDMTNWNRKDEFPAWLVEVKTPGLYRAILSYSSRVKTSDFELRIGDQALSGTAENTGHWRRFVPLEMGLIPIKGGKQVVLLKAIEFRSWVMNVRQLELLPIRE